MTFAPFRPYQDRTVCPIEMHDSSGVTRVVLWNRATDMFSTPLRIDTIWGYTVSGGGLAEVMSSIYAMPRVVSISITSSRPPRSPLTHAVDKATAAGVPASLINEIARTAAPATAARGRWITVNICPNTTPGAPLSGAPLREAAHLVVADAAHIETLLVAAGIPVRTADDPSDLTNYFAAFTSAPLPHPDTTSTAQESI